MCGRKQNLGQKLMNCLLHGSQIVFLIKREACHININIGIYLNVNMDESNGNVFGKGFYSTNNLYMRDLRNNY